MEGGSIIRSPCGTASVAGVSRAPLLSETVVSTPMKPSPFCSVLTSGSRSQIHASSTAATRCSRSTPTLCDEDSSLDKKKEDLKKRVETGIVYSEHSIFGPVPSKEEAEAAVSDLKLVSLPFSEFVRDEEISITKDAFDQVPSLCENLKGTSASTLSQSKPGDLTFESKSIISQVQHKVLNALHQLRINPSFQTMVVSLSTDKAVWNAIMKNERVQELRKTYHTDQYFKHAKYVERGSTARGSDDLTAHILSWLFANAKAKVMLFIEDIISLVNKLFHSEGKENIMGIVSDMVRSSFLASVLVFIVVILKRI